MNTIYTVPKKENLKDSVTYEDYVVNPEDNMDIVYIKECSIFYTEDSKEIDNENIFSR